MQNVISTSAQCMYIKIRKLCDITSNFSREIILAFSEEYSYVILISRCTLQCIVILTYYVADAPLLAPLLAPAPVEMRMQPR